MSWPRAFSSNSSIFWFAAILDWESRWTGAVVRPSHCLCDDVVVQVVLLEDVLPAGEVRHGWLLWIPLEEGRYALCSWSCVCAYVWELTWLNRCPNCRHLAWCGFIFGYKGAGVCWGTMWLSLYDVRVPLELHLFATKFLPAFNSTEFGFVKGDPKRPI